MWRASRPIARLLMDYALTQCWPTTMVQLATAGMGGYCFVIDFCILSADRDTFPSPTPVGEIYHHNSVAHQSSFYVKAALTVKEVGLQRYTNTAAQNFTRRQTRHTEGRSQDSAPQPWQCHAVPGVSAGPHDTSSKAQNSIYTEEKEKDTILRNHRRKEDKKVCQYITTNPAMKDV